MQGWQIRVRGQVQGVGFRPFVWRLARREGLVGAVSNDAEGVLVLAAGAAGALVRLRDGLAAEAPPLARVDAVEVADWAVPDPRPESFTIAASGAAGAETRVTPDAATCPECLAEIRDPGARRYGYAFTNCTHCGPRFTILRGLPYDRARTTMAPFEMCPACRADYEDPADRRFHAQPIACPDCGPKLWAETADGAALDGDALGLAGEALLAGRIVALKGLGGFHLACDATNPAAVAELRRRKRRPAKPFALMAGEPVLERYAAPSPQEWARLRSPAAPIVLIGKAGATLPEALAPGQGALGWMLPYTPLHHLLLDAVGRPLVMTSGNLSGEPQVIGNAEAREKLAGFADLFVMHDREIARRLDDSVERITLAGPMVLRRARGQVPGTLPLPEGFADAPQVLALGGQMKAAICLTKNGQALLGHHLGDLDDALTLQAFEQALEDYRALFDHRPEMVAVDLHHGYRATRAGEAMGLPVERVQHHHAHLAAVLGENLWPRDGGKVAAIVLDGLGLGDDGTIWGGEVLLGDYAGFERIGWLTPAPLAGGDAANREPWRNLMVRLDAAGLAGLADEILPDRPREPLRRAVAAGVNAPLSSSAGRLFDAFACALGVAPERMSYEGEAGMLLEAVAAGAGPVDGWPFDVAGGVIDPAPMWRAWAAARDTPAPEAAAMFHEGLAAAFARVARDAVSQGRAEAVALSGGVLQNAVLEAALLRHLDGVPVLRHAKVPANDGGLAFGQALVAGARALA
ncbi:carbamoyltransferase HypF [Maritimibacter sp. HL-12]|uniref:carbamoyltransferase HypF n=1 Tax=Maritimibacter sp. HL-12 TaxID=1162418 RepID=UPI000A0F34AC|nr:carbamoyltransferase HypF [Maritimibacter sp. HL-12]SMH50063.1 Hydrogenase maturation protein, carbamoyltransferase HypF [Maritimibacter sp. HL-12]